MKRTLISIAKTVECQLPGLKVFALQNVSHLSSRSTNSTAQS